MYIWFVHVLITSLCEHMNVLYVSTSDLWVPFADQKPWQLMVNILQDKSVTADSEVQAEVMTLVNKVRTHKQKPDLRTYIVQTIVYTGFLLIPKFLVV